MEAVTAEELAKCQRRLAELEAQNKALRAELNRLKTEDIQKRTEDVQKRTTQESSAETQFKAGGLFDVLNRMELQYERRFSQAACLASVYETMTPLAMSVREQELLEDLEWIRDLGRAISVKTAGLCDRINHQLPSMKLDPLETAKLRVAVEELAGLNGTFVRSLAPRAPRGHFRSCRILEVNSEYGLVILNAGFRDGVRMNMRLKSGEKGTKELRVIALRPFVSAAVTVDSKVNGLSVGMAADAWK